MRFAATVALVTVAAATLVAWTIWTRSEAYGMRKVRLDGMTLVEKASPKNRQEWIRALVLTGQYRDALESAHRVGDNAERAQTLAWVARALDMAEAEDLATVAAGEAITTARSLMPAGPALTAIAKSLVESRMLQSFATQAARAALDANDAGSATPVDTAAWSVPTLALAGKKDEARAAALQASDAANSITVPQDRLGSLAALFPVVQDVLDESFLLLLFDAAAKSEPIDRAYAYGEIARLTANSGHTTYAGNAANEWLRALPNDLDQGTRAEELAKIAQRLDAGGHPGNAVSVADHAIKEADEWRTTEKDAARLPPEQIEDRHGDIVRGAAQVLAANDRFDDALHAIEGIRSADTKAQALATIAERLLDRAAARTPGGGAREQGRAIHAAELAAETARASQSETRNNTLLRAAEALVRLSRANQAEKLLEEVTRSTMSAGGRAKRETPALRSRQMARLAEIWARAGHYGLARELAAGAGESDRLGAFARILFEKSRRKNPVLADWLERSI